MLEIALYSYNPVHAWLCFLEGYFFGIVVLYTPLPCVQARRGFLMLDNCFDMVYIYSNVILFRGSGITEPDGKQVIKSRGAEKRSHMVRKLTKSASLGVLAR